LNIIVHRPLRCDDEPRMTRILANQKDAAFHAPKSALGTPHYSSRSAEFRGVVLNTALSENTVEFGIH
jgi:hypothetical protein